MRYFLDTADLREIDRFLALGLVDGVTTNPALLARSVPTGTTAAAHVREICRWMDDDRPVSVELTTTGRPLADRLRQAETLTGLAPNVVVKVPATEAGLEVALVCRKRVRLNVTLIFSATSALTFLRALGGSRAPSHYFSLILDRAAELGASWSDDEARDLCAMIHESGHVPLAASIRTPATLWWAHRVGFRAATVPPATWDQILAHEYTVAGERAFLDAWTTLSPEQQEGYES